MACPSVLTGARFLESALAHIDCQARAIGSYGYGALADPGSATSIALTGMLTVFVALFGIRLLLGYPMAGRDLIGDVLKLAIVLTLATSWPAFRTIGYELVIDGPGEIARAIGLGAQLPGSAGDLAPRLQRVDEALAALNTYGSGRLGVAQGDWLQLGLARIAFLTGTLAPLALVRLSAGILLALAPLVAGLLLFGITRALFEGWARALAMVFFASISLALLLGAELALIEPWLADALVKRAGQTPTLDAPVEVLAVTISFALMALGMLVIIGWLAFHPPGWLTAPARAEREDRTRGPAASVPAGAGAIREALPTQARQVALSVHESLRREERFIEARAGLGNLQQGQSGAVPGAATVETPSRLGDSYRRNSRRISASNTRRDRNQ